MITPSACHCLRRSPADLAGGGAPPPHSSSHPYAHGHLASVALAARSSRGARAPSRPPARHVHNLCRWHIDLTGERTRRLARRQGAAFAARRGQVSMADQVGHRERCGYPGLVPARHPGRGGAVRRAAALGVPRAKRMHAPAAQAQLRWVRRCECPTAACAGAAHI